MTPLVSMRAALGDPALFGQVLAGDSWSSWRILLVAICGEPLTAEERVVFESLTGRPEEPGELVSESWTIAGRRSGKTRASAVLAAYFGALIDHRDRLAPGERGIIPVLASSTAQANKLYQYVAGIFAEAPGLKNLVKSVTADTISLKTSVDIQVRPADFKTIRGITAVAAIGDEVAFWGQDGSSVNPDSEILNALRPALATTGGPLICISTPYSRKGELYQTFKRHFGPNGDRSVLVAKAASRTLNPSLKQSTVDAAYERDAGAAAAQYGGEFRSDVESFVSIEAIEACTPERISERAKLNSNRYFAFVDPSGGSSDSFTIAIAHRENDVAVLDLLREVRPPFSPADVIASFATLAKSYGITTVFGDRYAGEFPRELFKNNGITYQPSAKTKNELYAELLPALNSRAVLLLDNPRLASQLISLERKIGRSGRDSIDHPVGMHDDVVNAVAGALALALVPVKKVGFASPYIASGPAMQKPGISYGPEYGGW